MTKMIKHSILALTSGLTILAPTATVLACSNPDGNGDEDWKIKIAYEKPWESVIKKTVAQMDESERDKFDLVPVDSALIYLDQITNKATDSKTADLFAAPVDRYSSLVSGSLLLDVTNELDSTKYVNDSIGKIDGKNYAFPVNTESIIQIYQNDLIEVAGFSKDGGFDSYENAFNYDYFLTKWADLWFASAYLNSILVGDSSQVKPEDLPAQWLVKDANDKYQYPFLEEDKLADGLKSLWTENQKLRDSGVTWKQNIANNNNQDRDSETRDHFIKGDIKAMIDGPWMINDLIARAIIADPDNETKIAASLNKISTAKLPTLNGNPSRHFKGGWGYSINKQKLATLNNQEGVAKKNLEIKFLSELTSANNKTEWFKAGGKISAAVGGEISLSAEDIKEMQLPNPTVKDEMIDLSKYSDTLALAMSKLYTSVINAVSAQSEFNVDQPSGEAWALWDFMDKEGLSNSSIKSADAFYQNFKTNAKNKLDELNA